MARKTILVGVNSKTGEVRIEAEGFEDASCFDATKELEEVFGTVIKVEEKPEAKRRARREVQIARGLPAGYCG
jgi:hypothetical protein